MSTIAFGNVDEEHGEFHDTPLTESEQKRAWIVFWALVAVLTYGYFNMIMYTASYWSKPLYSHGWIVPLFAGYLFYNRRQPLTRPEALDRWIAVAIIGGCFALRLWASYYHYNPLDRLSFIGCLVALALLVGGRRMLYWAGPALAFVIFMFPLPAKVEQTVLLQLQRVAAVSSTWVLQLLGVPALRDGSRIMIDQLPLEVADACSGLRMVTIFGAMTVAMALLVKRPWWDRLIILLSAIPIALVTNIIRITLTALLFMTFGMENKTLDTAIHDYAGFAMMPIALGLLWVELQVLSHLTVPIEDGDEFGTLSAAPG